MIFPYRAYDVEPTPSRPRTSVIYRPVIPIRLIGLAGDAVVLGLLDTGADETVLPAFLIKQLGIDVKPNRQATFRGVGGQLVTITFGTVAVEVSQGTASHRWETACGFLDRPTSAILGHRAFLENFAVTFEGQRREVSLQLRKKSRSTPAA